MTNLDHLGADSLRALVTSYRDALRSHQEVLNRLNVYPVPDGDTGTNMALTLESVVHELASADPAMAATCTAISHGSLMGARGNSGVILSQMLRAVSIKLSGAERAGAADVADALDAAATAAYAAVMKPVEGTILTVARETASAARTAADLGSSLVDVLDAARTKAQQSLAATTDLLPALRQAGVVDAGAAGFVLLLDAALAVVAARPLPVPDVVAPPAPVDRRSRQPAVESSELRYEVMFLLDASAAAVPELKATWATLGDSIVVVGGDGLWNCHVHTDEIGAAIEAGIAVGRPHAIRVTDLTEQVTELRHEATHVTELRHEATPLTELRHEATHVTELRHDEASTCGQPVMVEVQTAVVAVATGEGVHRILTSLGAHAVVAGGQSMNPSTADLLKAVESVPGRSVVVLPNNKNIIPVAEQVDELSTKEVRVVGTRSVPEAFAALLALDPSAEVDANVEAMAAAAGAVVTGEVTRAVRDSASEAGPIHEGDHLGLARDGIRVVQHSLEGALLGLLESLVKDDHEVVTLIAGDGAEPGTTERARAWLAEHRPGAVLEVHDGTQPLYPYLLGVE